MLTGEAMITIQFGERREMPFWWRLQNAHNPSGRRVDEECE